MENRQNMSKEREYSSSSRKIFGNSKLEIGEDSVSRVLGGIMEKGISDKPQINRFSHIPPPRPTVMPFPVARHRAHGPHWGPVAGDRGNGGDGDEDDDENEAFRGVNLMAAFANPVQRNERKGLDLSGGRKLMATDKPTNGREDTRNISNGESLVYSNRSVPMMAIDAEQDLNSCALPNHSKESVTSGSGVKYVDSVADMELENCNQPSDPDNMEIGRSSKMSINYQIGDERMFDDSSALPEVLYKRDKKPIIETTASTPRSSNFENGKNSVSLESEIDAENCAQLQRMSPDEIAQAQAEIMEKMDPALLNILKKRGINKVKNQKSSSSVLPSSVESSDGRKECQSIGIAKGSPPTEEDISHSQRGPDNGMVRVLDPAGGSLWRVWSERVEAVRELKFSLNGSVVSHETTPTSKSDDDSVQDKQFADKVGERDYLRTEGDPSAEGYTIKEAVALTRSAFSGHRVLGLRVLASVLDRASRNIYHNPVGSTLRFENKLDRSIDWEAVWAYVLGPEPELILSLRMRLEDNHYSVVSECLRVLRCSLSCDLNEHLFNISEKVANFGKDIYTAPVFRSKPEIDLGFLRGGYWKYNVKPSNIILSAEDDETEGKYTIQDDIVVAGQDFAAGLVRMGFLVSLRYLLEMKPTVPAEECIMSILIAIARHSPACASAIMNCERLVQTIFLRFTKNNNAEFQPLKMKSVRLLKVLAQSDKKNCAEFTKKGTFEAMTWQLYSSISFFEQWITLGREQRKLSSDLMVEQLRFWKICIQNGYCVSYFGDIFPALCLWLNPPSLEKLIENNVISEFASISTEAYLVLEALATRLPKLYSQELLECDLDTQTWSWSHVSPTIDSVLKWLDLENDLHVTKLLERKNRNESRSVFQDSAVAPLLWVYSSIMLFLSRVLDRVIREDSINQHGGDRHLPWLPEFVPKVGLEIVRNQFISVHGSGFLEELCHLRQRIGGETSLASVSLLHGLVRVIVSIDNLIQSAKSGSPSDSQEFSCSREEKVLKDGILMGSMVELKSVLKLFGELVMSEWQTVQGIETFGRGGPAPGLGLGWGASGGGFWSTNVLLAQADAQLLTHLLEILTVSFTQLPIGEDSNFAIQIITAALGICLIAGPRDKFVVERAVDILLQVPILRFLDFYARRYLQSNKRMKLFGWEYKEEDYLLFSKTLASHFKSRWLSLKSKKSKSTAGSSTSGNKIFKKGGVSLDTIHEDSEEPSNITSQSNFCTSTVEWAHQRLPLPMHWFLSPISAISDGKHSDSQYAPSTPNCVQDVNLLEVEKAGLFFILGIEAMTDFLSPNVSSPVRSVPLFWKLHSLSAMLYNGMSIIEDERSRDVLEALQEHYGRLLDEAPCSRSAHLLGDGGENCNLEILRFQSEIHDSYTTFIENFIEQFAAVSYGDLVYGRQVAVYLHRCVEAPVRLAAWNALSNARALELLPPIEKCISENGGYLEPLEDNEEILQAYMKSWTSGALDKAVTRGSMAYALVVHHLSSFIFNVDASDKLVLQNKLVKSLLRDCSRQQRHERMMLDVILYSKPSKPEVQQADIKRRFEVLKEACRGTSTLLNEIEKLKSCCICTREKLNG